MNDRPQDQSNFGGSGGRSAEYRDDLTVQDESGAAGTSFGGNANRDLGDNTDGVGRDHTDEVRTDETHKLISADKVQGTAVYDASGEKIGTVDSVMINKFSGKVAYAVLGIGGFLGIGERYAPLPWDELSYDTSLDGYRTSRGGEAFRDAPNYSRDEVDSYDYDSRSGEIDDYYGNEATQSSSMPSGGAGTAWGSSPATAHDSDGTGIGTSPASGSSNLNTGISGSGASGSGGTQGGTGATGGVGSTGQPI